MGKNIFNLIDDFLNKTTMYRLILYYLVFLWIVAVVLSFIGFLPFRPSDMALSLLIIIAVCWIANYIFSLVFKAQTNVESLYITAIILALIISPIQSADYFSGIPFLIWVSIWAMASKYILAVNKKHILNPVAFAVALTALTINQSASWWIGTMYMLPFVLIGGLLVVRKIHRSGLVISFFIVAIAVIMAFSILKGGSPLTSFTRILLNSPILFFAFVMLTEPLTTPPAKLFQILYGVLVGLMFAPQVHLWSIYSTPELALLIGNVFAYFISPGEKYVLKLKERTQIAPDIYDFAFDSDARVDFKPGQYLEWTLGHKWPDSRGNRRYFTISSSPSEDNLKMGVKFYDNSSSFKRTLMSMKVGDQIVASQLSGDFVLPKNKEKKLVFIAGGIGITPFRSMIKYLLDKNEKRTITLFFSNKTAPSIVYQDVFEEAREQLGIKTFYSITEPEPVLSLKAGRRGPITKESIISEVPDYKERTFYLSGPRGMVLSFRKILDEIGVKKGRVKTDFFPGFA